jgi:hypothetical protein
MFTKPIFETLPIAVIAAAILLMLLMHNIPAFIVGTLLIIAACIALYRRLSDLGTDPDVMDYVDTPKHTH